MRPGDIVQKTFVIDSPEGAEPFIDRKGVKWTDKSRTALAEEVKQFEVVEVTGDSAVLKRANRDGVVYTTTASLGELTMVKEA